MHLIDSHAHLQEDLFPGEVDQVIGRAKGAGIVAIVSIGTSLPESQEMIDLAGRYPGYIFPTVGLHPEDAVADIQGMSLSQLEEKFRALASQLGIVAIGECGLDYGKISDPPPTNEQKNVQKQIFVMQANIAKSIKLPLVIHCRNAWDDVFSLLTDDIVPDTVILHSFTGNEAVAKKAIDNGWYISFSGILTFQNAQDIQKTATIMPLENILVETDSPFLAPVPVRGSRNEPKNIQHTTEFLAKIRAISAENLAKITVENTKKALQLPV